MALTQSDKEYYREVLERTSGHRARERVIPLKYAAYLDQWSREK